MKKITLYILSIIVLASSPIAFANPDIDEKLEFAGTLEETLGHFWALEMNLDENNSKLALVHATHPISELYETMSGHLKANPEFSQKLEQTLLELKSNASTDVTRNDAQSAIDDAKEIIQKARDIVIGKELSNDSAFKAQLINGLLETSKVEYKEAMKDGVIVEIAEFQDGSAFIWRSQQIFEEIGSDVVAFGKVNDMYGQIWEAYEQKNTPTLVSLLVDEVIAEFEIVSGVKSKESAHMEVFETDESRIASLPPLKQIKEGVEPENIQCKESFELIFKSSGGPACVSKASVQKLIIRGWTQ